VNHTNFQQQRLRVDIKYTYQRQRNCTGRWKQETFLSTSMYSDKLLQTWWDGQSLCTKQHATL